MKKEVFFKMLDCLNECFYREVETEEEKEKCKIVVTTKDGTYLSVQVDNQIIYLYTNLPYQIILLIYELLRQWSK